MNEPRALPDYPETSDTRYYCFECVFQSVTEQEMKNHHNLQHDDKVPVRDFAYGMGDRYQLMRRFREKWIDGLAAEFGAEMHEGFGAEDFLAEAEIRSA